MTQFQGIKCLSPRENRVEHFISQHSVLMIVEESDDG